MDANHEAQSVGLIVIEQESAEAELRKLRTETRVLGLAFKRLGESLLADPTCVVFDGESWDGPYKALHVIRPDDLSIDRLRTLLRTFRDETTKATTARKFMEERKMGH